MVICCNGTSVKASKYTAVMKDLASWGFVVMGTEEGMRRPPGHLPGKMQKYF